MNRLWGLSALFLGVESFVVVFSFSDFVVLD